MKYLADSGPVVQQYLHIQHVTFMEALSGEELSCILVTKSITRHLQMDFLFGHKWTK